MLTAESIYYVSNLYPLIFLDIWRLDLLEGQIAARPVSELNMMVNYNSAGY